MAMLEIRDLNKYFGGLAAIKDLNLDVFNSEIVGLIGPNGAGKTTFFNVITGVYPPTLGSVLFMNQDITGLKTYKIAQFKIARNFQDSILFMKLSVLDNVVAGFHGNYKKAEWKSFMYIPSARKEERAAKRKALEILEFMGLASLKDELAANLPHGHQRILGICIALATNPKLLLLDEPATGMNPEETSNLIMLVKRIRDNGITIILVEHDMQAVMNLCNRIVVLNYGRKIAEGLPDEITKNEEVIEAYLGREEDYF